MESAARSVVSILGTLIPRPGPETVLAEDVRAALIKAGENAMREVPLTRGRVDLRVGGTAIELKVKGTAEKVEAQLLRYAEDPTVLDLVLVTTSAKLRAMPSTIGGKKLHVVYLPRL
jgi:hypothetical protein